VKLLTIKIIYTMKKLKEKFNSRLGMVVGLIMLVVTIVTLSSVFAVAAGIGTAFLFSSALVDQGSGKFGDMVISHNKAGTYIRKHKRPLQPHTAKQAALRGAFRNFTQAWRSNTIVRLQWNEMAALTPVSSKFGKTVYRTGHQWFVAINQEAQAAKGSLLTPLTTPPGLTPTIFPIETELQVVAETGPSAVTIELIKIGAYVTGEKLQIAATGYLSPGRTQTGGYKYKVIGYYDPTATPAIDITADYEAVFGPLRLGYQIFFQAKQIMPTTGEKSPKISASTIVIEAV
jgi:hypothetical protein